MVSPLRAINLRLRSVCLEQWKWKQVSPAVSWFLPLRLLLITSLYWITNAIVMSCVLQGSSMTFSLCTQTTRRRFLRWRWHIRANFSTSTDFLPIPSVPTPWLVMLLRQPYLQLQQRTYNHKHENVELHYSLSPAWHCHVSSCYLHVTIILIAYSVTSSMNFTHYRQLRVITLGHLMIWRMSSTHQHSPLLCIQTVIQVNFPFCRPLYSSGYLSLFWRRRQKLLFIYSDSCGSCA